MKKGKRRLLTGLLSMLLAVSQIASIGIQVQARELGTTWQDSVVDELIGEGIDSGIQDADELESDGEASDSLQEEAENQEAEGGDAEDMQGESDIADSGEETQAGESDNEDEKEDSQEDKSDSENMEEDRQEEEADSNEAKEDVFVEDAEENSNDFETALMLATSDDDIASGTYTEDGSNISWVIDKDGKLTVTGTGEVRYWTGGSILWTGYSSQIKTAEINISGISDASSMFLGCGNLTEVKFITFDTSNVTDMHDMFFECRSLMVVDVSGFDTAKVTDMNGMFWGCSSVTELDVSGFDTINVTDMTMMFGDCSSVKELDVSGFDTSKVTDMGGMFSGCSSVKELDVSGFDTSKVTDMGIMFSDCSSVTELDVSGFDTANVTDMGGMFSDCSNVTELDVSGFETANVTSMWGMFLGCSSVTELDVSSFDTANVTSMGYMFSNCSSLTKLDVSSFDTSNVTGILGMLCMFSGCSSLTKLDVSHFDTANVTNMSAMFGLCSGVTELDVSHFDTANVTDMSGMFLGCSSVTELDVSHFDTANVTDMSGMFWACSSVTELDVSSFDTAKVANMKNMFSACSSVTELDVSHFDTANVTDMGWMFWYCASLTQLDLSSFDTGNVENMESMLLSSSSLETIYTPLNVKASVSLPQAANTDVWYRSDTGETLTELPQNLSHSILLTKNKKAELQNRIVAQKDKTNYLCGETVEVDDLSVTYYGSDGSVRKLQSTDYATNVEEINRTMSVPGTKMLTVTYENGGSPLTADIELTVRYGLDGAHTTITLADADSLVYDGSPKTPVPTVVYHMQGNDTSVTKHTLEEGKDYAVSYRNNVNACEYIGGDFAESAPAVVITGLGDYSGTVTQAFIIRKAPAPAAEELKTYATQCQWPNTDRRLDLSGSFAAYGEKTGYQIISVVEDDTIEGNVFSVTPTAESIDESGVLTYSTNAGTEGDFATITVRVSFANYQDATLTVTITMIEKELVVISGITIADSVYTGRAISYSGTALVRKEDGTDVTGLVELVYTYSGTKADGSAYPGTDAWESAAMAPTDAGNYTLTITAESEDYQGSAEYPFTIEKAPLTITAKDVTLTKEEIEDALPDLYDYDITGLLNGDTLSGEPVFNYIDQSGAGIPADQIDRTKAGIYYIIPDGADAGMNYEIAYRRGMLIIADEKVAYRVNFDIMGHSTAPAAVVANAGSLLEEPKDLKEGDIVTSYIFAGWYKDKTFASKQKWNFATDTVQADTTLYACWLTAASGADTHGANLCVQEIGNQIYTGNAVKPNVMVYSGDGSTLLKSGRDYTIKYYNNKEADIEAELTMGGTGSSISDDSAGFTTELAYVVITGKGNYQGTICRNFHILPVSISADDESEEMTLASGFTLKCTEQLAVSASKAQKPFTSLKYKKAMKAGTDYEVKLTALEAYDAEGKPAQNGDGEVWTVTGSAADKYIPTIPAGYCGTFTMTVTGKGNYSGSFTKTIMVSDKNHLLKNAVVSLGKNIKTQEYDNGRELTLTPGYYDITEEKYYRFTDGNGTKELVDNAKDIFTVKVGNNYLVYGQDYCVSYTDNKSVGTATMTITGMGGYMGSRSVTFKIKGMAFNAKNITVKPDDPDNPNDTGGFMTSMSYTGKALTQNKVALTTKETDDSPSRVLVYGTHYTISYKNNIKKGTAAMTFTAKPESGYSGSFKKTFKITPQSLPDTGFDGSGEAVYSKNGAVLSFTLKDMQGMELKQGTDYTVSYRNNKAVTTEETQNLPFMTIKGKGNYSGTLTVTFKIKEADIGTAMNAGTLTVSAASVAKKDNMEFKDFRFKVLDGKKAMSAGEDKDYVLDESNCTPEIIRAYAEALETEGSGTTAPKPTVIIRGLGNYTGEREVSLTDYICIAKLTGSTLYAVVSEDDARTTYTGEQVTPEVTVYYGTATAVTAAKKNKETDETKLTDMSGEYGLTMLRLQPDAAEDGIGDYTLTYGTNITAGKNKGSVTVKGTGIYGGSVTVKFTIISKDVYTAVN